LLEALKNRMDIIRWGAADALGRLGSESALEPLIDLLGDKEPWVRSSAAEALGRIGSEAALAPLAEALKDEDRFVRWKAAEALGELGSEAALPYLKSVVEDEGEDEGVRCVATRALSRFGPSAAATLLDALEDKNRGVRANAAESLTAILGRLADTPSAEHTAR
jgi:HEAT repeat protein